MGGENIRIEVAGQIRGFRVCLTSEANPDDLQEQIKKLLTLIEKAGASATTDPKETPSTDEPIEKLAIEIDVTPSDLRRVVGFKDGIVQISKASQLQVTDAVCMLLLAYEKGYGQTSVSFELFGNLVQQNGIKLSYPLTTLAFNLKRLGHIQGKRYDDQHELSLSPQGEQNAISAFTDHVSGKGLKRLTRPLKKNTRKVVKKK